MVIDSRGRIYNTGIGDSFKVNGYKKMAAYSERSLKNIHEVVKSQFDCHIEFIEILAIKLIAFDKLRLTTLLRQPHFL